MRVTRILAVAAVGGVLCAASCVQSPEGGDVTGAHAPGVAIEHDSDSFGGDPDADPGIGSAPPDSASVSSSGTDGTPSDPGGSSSASSDPSDDGNPAGTREVCLAACKGGPEARAAFCRLLFDPVIQSSCLKRVSGSLTACTVWCYWEF